MVIPGNDDALRAIRLFTAKISESIGEGVQAAMKSGELVPAAEGQAAQAPAEAGPLSYDEEGKEYPGEPSEAEVVKQPESDDISMEQVLEQTASSKGRKNPQAASAAVEPAPDKVESHTV
jgi:small subunit ribosomal protein S2